MAQVKSLCLSLKEQDVIKRALTGLKYTCEAIGDEQDKSDLRVIRALLTKLA